MSAWRRCAGTAALAGLIGIAGCGTAPALALSAARLEVPSASTRPACAQPGSYLTAIRVGRHSGFDRVVFPARRAGARRPAAAQDLHRAGRAGALLPAAAHGQPGGRFRRGLAFGLGLAAGGGYHVFALTSPSRLVIDVSHVALGKFPGIWGVTSWRGYWAAQYSTPG